MHLDHEVMSRAIGYESDDYNTLQHTAPHCTTLKRPCKSCHENRYLHESCHVCMNESYVTHFLFTYSERPVICCIYIHVYRNIHVCLSYRYVHIYMHISQHIYAHRRSSVGSVESSPPHLSKHFSTLLLLYSYQI